MSILGDLETHRKNAEEKPQCCRKYVEHYGRIAKQYIEASEVYARSATEALKVQAVYLEAIGKEESL
jgi:hypothetical protein